MVILKKFNEARGPMKMSRCLLLIKNNMALTVQMYNHHSIWFQRKHSIEFLIVLVQPYFLPFIT